MKSYVYGCETSLAREVTINVVPVPQISSVISGMHCKAGQVTLGATGAPADGYYYWYESKNSTSHSKDSSGTLVTSNLTNSTTYFVSAVNALGCEGSKVPVMAEIVNYPEAHISAQGDTLYSNFTVGNQWFFNNVVIPHATKSFLIINEPGRYKVQVSVAGCTTESEYEFVISGVEDSSSILQINIFPNPVNEMLIIEVPSGLRDVKANILNVLGQQVDKVLMEVQENGILGSYNFKELPPGTYLVRVKTSSGTLDTKIIKQ
ncbi:MAG: T9SS type A sorting domain-containing protein [Cyclobacteriaceae bacterium]|nr:T9SS type A sorting domain-containing protein [Cyclobacteriaceae bacterium]